jgi:hypothetical protein
MRKLTFGPDESVYNALIYNLREMSSSWRDGDVTQQALQTTPADLGGINHSL